MIPQHKKRMDRAEQCCAAMREYLAMPVSHPDRQKAFNIVYKSLIKWMRVAPKDVMYKLRFPFIAEEPLSGVEQNG